MPTDTKQTFSLGREENCPMATCDDSKEKSKKSQKKMYYPTVYVYEAPSGLAAALKDFPAEGGYVRVKIVPTRATETTVLSKDQERKDTASVEFEIRDIEIPKSADMDSDEEESEEEGLSARSLDDAARSVGLKLEE